ncbi:MAG: prenyltransferase/squalene oxidase repeat-containing protein [Chthoniobacteraceae bacterium]
MNDAPDEKPFSRKLQERLAASRFFTFSLLLHVIIVVLGGGVVLFKAYIEPPDFVSEGGGLVSAEEVTAQPPEDTPDPSEQIFTPDQPEISAPTVDAITTSNLQASFKISSVPTPIKPVATDISKSVAQATKSLAKGLGKGVPSTMAGRMGGSQRAAAMMKNKGKEKSERAVMKGLRWLKDHQNEDGSWAEEHRPSMTGFAILCYLGHGETPESPEFGPTVKKGLDWLLAKGTEYQGRMSMTRDGWGEGNEGVYEHAIASYAIGEYYTMTKDDRFAEVVKQSVGYIVEGQAPDGGWQYRYAKGPNSDTSVSGWQIQALKAAHLTGLEIPGVEEALDKSVLNLKRVQAENGSFGYTKPGDRDYSLDGVGVLCTYFVKQDKDRSVRDGIEHMLRQTDKDHPVKYKGKAADLYAWYYNTQACLMMGGSAWSKWNRLFQDEIADSQSEDGSWPPVGGEPPGGELQKKADGAGPFYRTSLCILMLEVFYRYMPVTKG